MRARVEAEEEGGQAWLKKFRLWGEDRDDEAHCLRYG